MNEVPEVDETQNAEIIDDGPTEQEQMRATLMSGLCAVIFVVGCIVCFVIYN